MKKKTYKKPFIREKQVKTSFFLASRGYGDDDLLFSTLIASGSGSTSDNCGSVSGGPGGGGDGSASA